AQGTVCGRAGRARHDRRVRARGSHLGVDLRSHPGERDTRRGACRSARRRGLSRRRDGVSAMLAVDHLQAAYGPAQVLFDIGLRVRAGERFTRLGRNGLGKTPTCRTRMGLLPACGGTAAFEGVSLIGLPPYRIAQAGLGLVPEGRWIFPTLSVEENLI